MLLEWIIFLLTLIPHLIYLMITIGHNLMRRHISIERSLKHYTVYLVRRQDICYSFIKDFLTDNIIDILSIILKCSATNIHYDYITF